MGRSAALAYSRRARPARTATLPEIDLTLTVPGGPRLEARRAAAGRAGLVACHPHPLYGGDMDNPVVIRAVEVAQESGLATLRFNFRGVGRSGGTHGDGEAELDDAAAAVATLRATLPVGAPVGLLGYSFGARVASRVAAIDPTLAALALVAPPMAMYDWGHVASGPRPLLLVAGTRDTYCPVSALDELAALVPGAERVLIDGADHFFFGKLFPLGEAVGAWIRRWGGSELRAGAAGGGSPPPRRG